MKKNHKMFKTVNVRNPIYKYFLFVVLLVTLIGCSEDNESKFKKVLDKDKYSIEERKEIIISIKDSKYIKDLINNRSLEPVLRVFAAERLHLYVFVEGEDHTKWKMIDDCPFDNLNSESPEFLWLLLNSKVFKHECAQDAWRYIEDCVFINKKLKTVADTDVFLKYDVIDKLCEADVIRNFVFSDTDVMYQTRAVSNKNLNQDDIRNIFFNHKSNKVKWAAVKRMDSIDSDKIRKLLVKIIQQNDFDESDSFSRVYRLVKKFSDKKLLKQIVLETKRADFASLALSEPEKISMDASDFEFILACLRLLYGKELKPDQDDYGKSYRRDLINRVFHDKFNEFENNAIEGINFYYKISKEYKDIQWGIFWDVLEWNATSTIRLSKLKNNPLGKLKKYTENYLDYLFHIKSPILNKVLGPLGVNFTLVNRDEKKYTMTTHYSDGSYSKQTTLVSDTVNVKIFNKDTGEIYVDNNRTAAKLEDHMERLPDPFYDEDFKRFKENRNSKGTIFQEEIRILLDRLDNTALIKVSQSHVTKLEKVALKILSERRNSAIKFKE